MPDRCESEYIDMDTNTDHWYPEPSKLKSDIDTLITKPVNAIFKNFTRDVENVIIMLIFSHTT